METPDGTTPGTGHDLWSTHDTHGEPPPLDGTRTQSLPPNPSHSACDSTHVQVLAHSPCSRGATSDVRSASAPTLTRRHVGDPKQSDPSRELGVRRLEDLGVRVRSDRRGRRPLDETRASAPELGVLFPPPPPRPSLRPRTNPCPPENVVHGNLWGMGTVVCVNQGKTGPALPLLSPLGTRLFRQNEVLPPSGKGIPDPCEEGQEGPGLGTAWTSTRPRRDGQVRGTGTP